MKLHNIDPKLKEGAKAIAKAVCKYAVIGCVCYIASRKALEDGEWKIDMYVNDQKVGYVDSE